MQELILYIKPTQADNATADYVKADLMQDEIVTLTTNVLFMEKQ